jgi:RNA polymerase sigma-70 factor (ECF subfamily)
VLTLEKNDDDDLIAQLYRSMYKKLFLAAFSKLRNYHTAEDITQDVFTFAQKKRKELSTHPNQEGWLFDVLKNKLKHELRAKTRFTAMQSKLEAQLPISHPSEIGFSRRIIDSLTEKEYKMMKMIYIEGFTIREVSEKLDIQYDTCRRQVQNAKEKVRFVINDE